MEAKVGIEFEGTNFLCKIDKASTLQDNIDAFCAKNQLANESYGLKFSYTADGANLDHYVTEENFYQIQDGVTLKLVESAESVVDRIIPNMVYERQQTFRELFALGTDPGFIKALFEKGRHQDVLQWLSDKYLAGEELSACLLALLHLLRKQYITELAAPIVSNIIQCVKHPNTHPSQLKYALAVLSQILYLKGHEPTKHMIISELTIGDLVPFIWSQEYACLQLNTIMLMNGMVKSVKGEKRMVLTRQLNKTKNKEYLFKNVIKNRKVEPAMARELYVYQTYILGLYAEALNNRVDLTDNNAAVDLEEATRSRSNSIGTILEEGDYRLSFASMESTKSSDSELSNNTSRHSEIANGQISALTYNCLVHYKRNHHKIFAKSQVEENTHEIGFFTSSDRIMGLLAKILRIGQEPAKGSKFYHPLIFNASVDLPFLPELFCRTMWLLSKCRKEMKAWTLADYSKVLIVLEKQVQMVLEQKPMDYASLTMRMRKITYEEVDKQWQDEKDEEWKVLYAKNPSVQQLKTAFKAKNEKLIYENRIKLLQNGSMFPKLPEKKGKQQHFFLRLSDNGRRILSLEWDDNVPDYKPKDPDEFNLTDIKHFIIGKACPHVKDHSTKEPQRAFSLILNDGTTFNFLARDIKSANHWTDGFSLLLGKEHRSASYVEELETLQEMDCALHLLELQHISIPDKPPPIPPLPPTLHRPLIPCKSPKLQMRKTLTAQQKNSRKNIHEKTGTISEL